MAGTEAAPWGDGTTISEDDYQNGRADPEMMPIHPRDPALNTDLFRSTVGSALEAGDTIERGLAAQGIQPFSERDGVKKYSITHHAALLGAQAERDKEMFRAYRGLLRSRYPTQTHAMETSLEAARDFMRHASPHMRSQFLADVALRNLAVHSRREARLWERQLDARRHASTHENPDAITDPRYRLEGRLYKSLRETPAGTPEHARLTATLNRIQGKNIQDFVQSRTHRVTESVPGSPQWRVSAAMHNGF